MFSDASDYWWGSVLAQMLQAEFDRSIAVEDMSHEPLRFLSGVFRELQPRWPTVDEQALGILSTFRRLEYLLRTGGSIFTHHRNLVYNFDREAWKSDVSKTAAHRLEGWTMVVRQFDWTIVRIFGEQNRWGDFLSR